MMRMKRNISFIIISSLKGNLPKNGIKSIVI